MSYTVQTRKYESSKEQELVSSEAIRQEKIELLCAVNYSNTLPDIPFDPKFISVPFDKNR